MFKIFFYRAFLPLLSLGINLLSVWAAPIFSTTIFFSKGTQKKNHRESSCYRVPQISRFESIFI
jgi:hypothetical protein